MRRSFLALSTALLVCLSLHSSASAQDALPVVEIETSKGVLVVELNSEKAPKTVKNFLQYVESGFYDQTIFHRVIETFMIQGGGRTVDLGKKETAAPVENEGGNGVGHKPYTIAMARTGDPDSATSQFFINTGDNRESLDRSGSNAGYAVFGRVIKGLDVVDAIAKVETATKPNPDPVPPQLKSRFPNGLPPMADVPVEPVIIKSVKLRK